tara:strand:- start:1915 stop:2664 length:750 start_codon:yes stop_codon:yes gene_type:complete
MAITFLDLKNQLSTMLGASGVADLPPVDQARIGIYVNQAYRECYLPIDGRRPHWSAREITLTFAEDQLFAELDRDVIDVDKIPELLGIGPLSPFSSPEDEIRVRSHYSHDFKAPGFRGPGWPRFHTKEAEKGQPLWYYVDTMDKGTDDSVKTRFYVYPRPDSDYQVRVRANIMPAELSNDTDEPRLPGDVVWDILFPIAQEKLLSDPRYNGQNREFLEKAAMSARKRLNTLSTPQKHKGSLRLTKRGGW